jgi:hypothetical protein
MMHASQIPKVMLPGGVWLIETVSPHTLHFVVIFAPFETLELFAQPQRTIYLSQMTLTRHATSYCEALFLHSHGAMSQE